MSKIKYMGSSDTRILKKGEDFGGQLSEAAALDRDIVWSWENKHVIDTSEYEGVHDEFWKLLLDYSAPGGPKEFKDVSDLARIPTNEAQQIWRGLPKSEKTADDDSTDESEAGDGEGAVNESGTAETDTTDADAAVGTSEATDTGADTSTVGGSTRTTGRGRSTRS